MLYSLIDGSNGYYVNKTQKSMRSRINVNFRIAANNKLEDKLMSEAEKLKIINKNSQMWALFSKYMFV